MRAAGDEEDLALGCSGLGRGTAGAAGAWPPDERYRGEAASRLGLRPSRPRAPAAQDRGGGADVDGAGWESRARRPRRRSPRRLVVARRADPAPANAPVGPKPSDFDRGRRRAHESATRQCTAGGAAAITGAARWCCSTRWATIGARCSTARGCSPSTASARCSSTSAPTARPAAAGSRSACANRDAHAAVRFARDRTDGERVGAVGYSLGGASALLGARPIDVDALVLEAVYPSLLEAIEARIAMRMGRLSSKILAPLFLAQVKPRIGAPISALRPIEGSADSRARCSSRVEATIRRRRSHRSSALFAAAPEPKELWESRGRRARGLSRTRPGRVPGSRPRFPAPPSRLGGPGAARDVREPCGRVEWNPSWG